MSAYADDVNVIVKGQRDVQEIEGSLALYQKAASAKVNWEKSEACAVETLSPPGNVRQGKRSMEVLGVYLGNDDLLCNFNLFIYLVSWLIFYL